MIWYCCIFHSVTIFTGAKIPTVNDDAGVNVLEEEEGGSEVTEVKDLDQEARREEGRPGGPAVR